jgi:LacI family transcriptional regulator
MMVMLCNSNEDPDRESKHLRLLEQHRVMGILLSPVLDDEAELARLAERGMPVVLVDRHSVGSYCSVSVDDVAGGRLAAAHLLSTGHQRLVYLTGPLAVRQASDRLKGAREAIRQAGLPEDILHVAEGRHFSLDEGRTIASALAVTRGSERITGVFCANDLLAIGCLQGFIQSGCKVPEEICIIGYDDIDFAGAAVVPLTSVRQPRLEIGQAAMRLLLEEVADSDDHAHRDVVFKPELVVRQSSAL